MLGAMFGLCLGGPVGLLAGVKLGGVAAVGGSILGYAGATVVREQRDLRTYIDEHYVREPELYVLSPREEALLARRLSVQEQRHLPPSRPGSRRGPAGYRRPSTASCSSMASARRRPGSLRAGREPRPAPPHLARPAPPHLARPAPPHLARPAPPHLARPSFRRLGDLPEAEQRSVMALIYSAQVVHLQEEINLQPCSLQPSTLQPGSLQPRDGRKRSGGSSRRTRCSSLPDVLEEDTLSVKSK